MFLVGGIANGAGKDPYMLSGGLTGSELPGDSSGSLACAYGADSAAEEHRKFIPTHHGLEGSIVLTAVSHQLLGLMQVVSGDVGSDRSGGRARIARGGRGTEVQYLLRPLGVRLV